MVVGQGGGKPHLMWPMLHLLERTLSDSDLDGHIIDAYRNMCELNDIVASGGIIFTDAESTSVESNGGRLNGI